MSIASEQTPLKVSVIIPTYNRAGYLREALNSVFGQNLAPWEVIVVDDGSTDDTYQVVQDALGPVCYFEQRHQGVAAARNLGLEKASGELIAWLDSDDMWEPNFLATVVPMLARDETLDGVYTGITMIDADGVRYRSSMRIVPPQRLHEALIQGNFLATPSLVVRKRCYDQTTGFDPQLPIGEDYDMWLQLSRQFHIVGVSGSLVRIRVHGSNTMADDEGANTALFRIAAKHFGALGDDPTHLSDAGRAAYGYAYRVAAFRCIKSGRHARGWFHLAKAAELHPVILTQLDTYYELALGDQPRTCRGDAKALDIASNGAEVLRRLDALFAAASGPVLALRSAAYSKANLALAMLSDQAGDWRLARSYIWQAVAAYPRIVISPNVLRRTAKLLAGKRLIGMLRAWTGYGSTTGHWEEEV